MFNGYKVYDEDECHKLSPNIHKKTRTRNNNDDDVDDNDDDDDDDI
jgi:hypothetical protein